MTIMTTTKGKGPFEPVIAFDGKRWVKTRPLQAMLEETDAHDMAKMDADKLHMVIGLILCGLGYEPDTKEA